MRLFGSFNTVLYCILRWVINPRSGVNHMIWSAQSGNGFFSMQFNFSFLFFSRSLDWRFRQTISFWWLWPFLLMGAFDVAPRYLIWWECILIAFEAEHKSFFVGATRLLSMDRKITGMVSSLYLQDIEITLGDKPSLVFGRWSLWRGWCLNSHSSSIYFTTHKWWKKRAITTEKEAKLKNEQNFFKVFETFFSKEKILSWLSLTNSCWFYRPWGRINNWSDWLHLFFSMKRSMEDMQSALSDYGLI